MTSTTSCRGYFYPRPPRGGRLAVASSSSTSVSFLSTPSARRATAWAVCILPLWAYFYPRPPRGGRPEPLLPYHCVCSISIHALREEGDYPTWLRFCGCCYFYPRPPRGGRPASAPHSTSTPRNFYPRPPRGGRRGPASRVSPTRNFYPRPPRGGRPMGAGGGVVLPIFLSTPSARRATWFLRSPPAMRANFYPRPPRGGRQPAYLRQHQDERISIHALREEGDGAHQVSTHFKIRISIHALREEGDATRRLYGTRAETFLSTPSARRATMTYDEEHIPYGISIHALREEGDPSLGSYLSQLVNFYPRPPRGGRPRLEAGDASIKAFLSTPSARRATNRAQAIRTAK